ncbi:unnamed protein product [Paramecium sonneborni]|uniref:P-loop containing nucleoside triphosphate hydrolase n=1 Tax=Paramecium sonneborni TaxID=65129 RepID=A0A8S1MUU1_9CILI|nr:unnamed protein product [Paramecium sonneborni]
MQANQEQVLKLLLTGSVSVGKSAFVNQFKGQEFNEKYIPTIGVDFNEMNLELSGKTQKLQIWDTSGQEKFMPIVSSYFRGSHGIFILYDISNKQSFNDVQKWLQQVNKQGNKNVCKMLIGNKNDLQDARQVSLDEAQQLANDSGMSFMEISAKNGLNVKQAIRLLTTEILNQQEKQKQENQAEQK